MDGPRALPIESDSAGVAEKLPWASVSALVEWIERVRWEAFRNGARHDDISKAEAGALRAALTASPIPPSTAGEEK